MYQNRHHQIGRNHKKDWLHHLELDPLPDPVSDLIIATRTSRFAHILSRNAVLSRAFPEFTLCFRFDVLLLLSGSCSVRDPYILTIFIFITRCLSIDIVWHISLCSVRKNVR